METFRKGDRKIFNTNDRRLKHLSGAVVEVVRVLQPVVDDGGMMPAYDVAVMMCKKSPSSEGHIITAYHDELYKDLSNGNP